MFSPSALQKMVQEVMRHKSARTATLRSRTGLMTTVDALSGLWPADHERCAGRWSVFVLNDEKGETINE